ncbi:ureidoglycolate lyase [Pusillimonas sp. MFBS29]|uniref:ureidoglycolate lyase n=1 Tax=Pusillimonas sp. MFBS29 TaxID=2886690 RepID=UPI001D109815|nr:ureidoglycolate lyase [Pusillimonas sp. MFBS29]MCC2596341.1 ureidoglycolate lyase [Pusillimonas sp. MFBS29]
MSQHYLPVVPLTREAFMPYGDVIEASSQVKHFTINDGNTERYHDLAHIDPGHDGKAIVSIFRGLPRTLPFQVSMMERHPRGSQAFMPLSGQPYLVVVAPEGEPPALEQLRVFFCQGTQGVNYRTGVWHHPLLALNAVSDFLVIDRSGPGENCDVVGISPAGLIALPE